MMTQSFIESDKRKTNAKLGAELTQGILEVSREKELRYRMMYTLDFTKATIERVIKTVLPRNNINTYYKIRVENIKKCSDFINSLSRKAADLEDNKSNKLFEKINNVLEKIVVLLSNNVNITEINDYEIRNNILQIQNTVILKCME